MITLPVDMLAAAESIPPAEEWLLACIKMPSGDVWLSDRPASPELRALLPAEPLAAVEDWGVLDDGGTVDGLLSTGNAGNLECPTIKISVLRADQTKTQIDAIINQGIHNRRIELYRWFTDMTSAPVLIDTLFIQDKIELAESSMLWSFEAVGCLAAENPRMSELDGKGRSWPYLIGKTQGVPLTLLESESSKWTELIGDTDGNEVSETYTGLIRVKDASKLRSGYHLINGEYVYLSSASAGYMRLSQRGSSLTEPQEHSSGSRIFPAGAVFRYAVCAGPVGSFDLLRTSNEVDIYDEDGDGNTTEYRDLCDQGEFHPELNPAQIWFSDRMPFLWKDQEVDISEKVFYGSSFSFSESRLCVNPSEVNVSSGKAAIEIDFQEFSKPSSDYWYTDTDLSLPAIPGDVSALGSTTYSASSNIKQNLGYFDISQSEGQYITNMSSTAYRQILVNGTCPEGEECWTSISPVIPGDGFLKYVGSGNYYAITFQRVFTRFMQIRLRVVIVKPDRSEITLAITPSAQAQLFSLGVLTMGFNFDLIFPGSIIGDTEWFPTGYSMSNVISIGKNDRVKMYVKLELKDPVVPPRNPFAFLRIGGKSAYSDKFHYGMATFFRYYDNAPSSWLSSRFGKNLSSRGVFGSAKVLVKGKIKNTNNLATGTLKIYENGTEKYSTAISDGDEVSQEIPISAASWIELQNTTVKLEIQLDYLGKTDGDAWTAVPRTSGSAGFFLDGGIKWLLTYKSTTLDGLQVNYTDALYVDAVSTRGPDWTPARALRWISEDKATWAADMLDTDALDDRHAEYAAAGHVLNGLRAEERYQDVIREVLRQGFARPIQSGGKLSIVNHLTDAAALPIMTAALDDLFSKSQTFTTTDTPQLAQKIILNYNKNLSTGEWDGKRELATGQPVQELAQIDLDMVNSATAVQLAAAWLYALKTVQLQVFGYAGNFRMISAQKADKINLPSFLLDNALREMLTVNVKQDFGKGKTGKMTKFLIQAIRRL